MCGRYVVATPPRQLALDFGTVLDVEDLAPDYNVAPTKSVPAVLVRGEQRVLTTLRWGLVPFWAKDPAIGARMINARVESAAEKPAFRRPFAMRRCLVPADGYYEWRAAQAGETAPAETGAASKGAARPRKQPYFIHPAEGGPMAFAGLYERWRGPEGDVLWSVSILTGAAADSYAWIHDRMPLTVARAGWEAWLDPALTDPQEARSLIEFEPHWAATPVSDRVNAVRNNGPELIEPVATGAAEAGMGRPDASF